MNIQAMMMKAQKLQKDMEVEQDKLSKEDFSEQTSFVTVVAFGNKVIKAVKIDIDIIEKDDIEMLEDLIVVTTNKVFDKIDKETEDRMSKYSQGLPGLF